ncbi:MULTISPECIES: galactose-6-phosphate isomerase subunit LacA [Enterococcus]|uniref:Galactose-6-phosphate isomerase subunit LacA n=1 Tax=Enterococcus thailandicus TaxID=417368 RepID=A0A179EVB2_ENTTH|nr:MULTISPECIES: galactose-6-phosphate isomerase subunit LacA [Enterococcus]ASZ07812.1 galactose-6-phosphate isomerase subunit LacA [Enterococcus thailandicus]MDA3963953.1 galactose-6-phosphate isomerase subunit LacA [Enterococcus thailandicus]MDK4350829.1 galactose-6-phosphate isomerase subunit LacA [Enterococcus thailandicus]MDT2733517.1 galactose-6-phosphate isomerase subunit LacA [Enterococcus thailandicus]MDT2750485.1 galactose-6-phosphate isomerase subunit LacA [Enterococcus thailandicus
MKIVIGSDEQGMKLKEPIKEYLLKKGFEVVDKSETASTDFIESTLAVATDVLAEEGSLGIAFDGYGAGSFMTATKVKGMVAAEVSDERSAYMTREHNNARMITIGSEIVGEGLAKNIVKEFLAADYDGGRHQIRVDMLNKMA